MIKIEKEMQICADIVFYYIGFPTDNPRNVTIQRQYEDTAGLVYSYRCYADGNPPPECDWTVTAKERNISHSGCILCLPENLSYGWEIMVVCEATNIIGKNVTTIKVNFAGTYDHFII